MKKRPIIFSTPMIQAILKGRKTQTRRVIKPQPTYPYWCGIGHGWDDGHGYEIKCRYEVGDILWVRETWANTYNILTDDKREIRKYIYKADNSYLPSGFDDSVWQKVKWRPAIYMPYEAARIFLKVKNIKIERLQDITEEDAISEGIQKQTIYDSFRKPKAYVYCNTCKDTAKEAFQMLWDSINAKRGFDWNTNPYVWVIEFEKFLGNEQ
jgi:hypothetical protein